MNKLIYLAASAAIFTSQAIAADMATYDPAPIAPAEVAVFDWNGAYLGTHIGYGWGRTHDVANPAADKKDLDGILGGLQAGYNYQLPSNFVLGVEADLSLANIEDRWEGRDTNPFDAYYTEDKITAAGTLRARLGYAMENFLPYVTGGLAVARTKHVLGCDPALAPAGLGCALPFEDSKSDTSVGWTVGAGAEYAFNRSWSLKAEYLYTDLGKNNVTLTDPNYPALSGREFDTSFHTVRFGLNYRF